MEKLLHERLREIEAKDRIDGLSIGHGTIPIRPSEARFLADEIERYYIPRPRDNEGIPFTEGEIVYSIDPDTEYGAEVISVGQSTILVLWDDGEYDVIDACDMQHEKPQPKVFDANGEEINIGDTLFWTCDVDESIYVYTVDRIEFDESKESSIQVWNVDGHWMPPEQLTHKYPDSRDKVINNMVNFINGWDATNSHNIDLMRSKLDEYVNRLVYLEERQ